MSNAPEHLMTPEGMAKLQEELDHLVNVWRPNIAERIKSARELGDLKENGEYHAAKDEQGLYESKIQQIEQKLRNAKVVDEIDTSVAGIGCEVTIVDDTGARSTFKLVGSDEADPLEDKVSIESPIGTALTGAKIGDTVEAALPRTTMKMTVEKISAA
jgi:transcription elongation factor GreA